MNFANTRSIARVLTLVAIAIGGVALASSSGFVGYSELTLAEADAADCEAAFMLRYPTTSQPMMEDEKVLFARNFYVNKCMRGRGYTLKVLENDCMKQQITSSDPPPSCMRPPSIWLALRLKLRNKS